MTVTVESPDLRIIADGLRFPEGPVCMPDGSVALVVTSPPYFAGKAYETELDADHVPATYLEYLQMLRDVVAPGKQVTVGADKAYDTKGFVNACRELGVTPHVAQNLNRNGGSAIDGRTTRHIGYEVSQRKRKCIEQCFGWGKLVGPIRQVMVQGLDKVDQLLTLTMAAYNLTRLRTLAQLRLQCAQ